MGNPQNADHGAYARDRQGGFCGTGDSLGPFPRFRSQNQCFGAAWCVLTNTRQADLESLFACINLPGGRSARAASTDSDGGSTTTMHSVVCVCASKLLVDWWLCSSAPALPIAQQGMQETSNLSCWLIGGCAVLLQPCQSHNRACRKREARAEDAWLTRAIP